MIFSRIILFFLIIPLVKNKIYLSNTDDGLSIEFYDCFSDNNLFYCRRPNSPVTLYRNEMNRLCHNDGIPHSFISLLEDDINVSTILHQWKSGVENAEEYSRYKHQRQLGKSIEEDEKYLCQCNHSQAFGKHCEYLLPMGFTVKDTINWQTERKRNYPVGMQVYGDILCYRTLSCNSGLLCLDWRDICDGVQQCMLGLDEENCDLLEFNECEDEEYRCMNGMCIPQKYFLDGDLDCADLTDEKGIVSSGQCAYKQATFECDDRMCIDGWWSCGDGQCIENRLGFQTTDSECKSHRDQYYMCETHVQIKRWTLPNGKCGSVGNYVENAVENRSASEMCIYFLKCAVSVGGDINCPCESRSSCLDSMKDSCTSPIIRYPNGEIVAPYISYYYDISSGRTSYLPDFFEMNATIKCRGSMTEHYLRLNYSFIPNLIYFEEQLCEFSSNNSLLNERGYDRFCHNETRTFNNRSYHFIDVCKSKCLSAYRIMDALRNCASEDDEKQNLLVETVCLNVQHYRFQCSKEYPTCFSIISMGDGYQHCENKYDEWWMGTESKLSDMICNAQSKEHCQRIDEYLQISWQTDLNKNSSIQINPSNIPFRSFCNTLWDLGSKKDEDLKMCEFWWICLDNQWRCQTGQCIDIEWLLDGEWDCPDASDEEGLYVSGSPNSVHNLKIINNNTLREKFDNLYKVQPFWTICNLTFEYPCFRIDASDPLDVENNRPCINLTQIGDRTVDCVGGWDERNSDFDCATSTMLGYNFKCPSTDKSISYSRNCIDKCDDSLVQCYGYRRASSCSGSTDFMCLNDTCAKYGWCDGKFDCSYGEDELMCIRRNDSIPYSSFYRWDKEQEVKTSQQKVHLPEFPDNINKSEVIDVIRNDLSDVSRENESFHSMSALVPYWCNRGIGIYLSNDSIACFCPPQYYGNKCQYYNDRLTVFVRLNLSQSIYTDLKDPKITLKFLIIFLYKNEPLMTEQFHIRTFDESNVYRKRFRYLLYSRSNQSLVEKQIRYFNRSNVINEHPYSVRIEVYDINGIQKPSKLIAVWLYPIYFDFLPSFRLSKILHLTKLDEKRSSCSSNPCAPSEVCHTIMNKNSSYICLCPENYKGKDCLVLDPVCNNSFCSPNSLCKPGYRGSLNGNEKPFCICPFNQYGPRCHLTYDQCDSNPCQNNGTCFPKFEPDEFSCLCDDHHYGEKCHYTKRSVQLYINESVEHKVAVAQYFGINFYSLDLKLIHQSVYDNSPSLLNFFHNEKTVPEIILVKLYSNIPIGIYLISLQINAESINGTTQINEKTVCIPVQTLFENKNDVSSFKYHYLCQNRTLLCFTDNSYLCICDKSHSRVECFGYDQSLDQCSNCLGGGLCIRKNPPGREFLCICPPCFSGEICQFNSESFSFTLDQLFATNLGSNDVMGRRTTTVLLIFGSWFLFLIGLMNNGCCLMTFYRRRCQRNGIGQYLLYMSVVNQINLSLLALRLTHLSLDHNSFRLNPSIDRISCKLFNYLLTASTRIPYWLVALIAIERVYVTLFLNGQWLKKPSIAKRLILLLFLLILGTGAYELIFVQSHVDSTEGKGAMCILTFPRDHQGWTRLHQTITAIHALLPFLINLCCTITISCIVINKKMIINANANIVYTIPTDANESATPEQQENTVSKDPEDQVSPPTNLIEQQNRFIIFRDVLLENKELILGPAFTLIPQLFSLPLFVISVAFACQDIETSSLRYLLIVSYFTSFIPQLITFFLYISPSSFYTREWRATTFGKWIHNLHQQIPPSTNNVFSTVRDISRSEVIKYNH